MPIIPAISSQISSDAPASRLYTELLLAIFCLNSDMYLPSEEDAYAIDTLRYTSQVCSAWRSIALESPALWAQVLNLNRLQHLSKNWMCKIIERTKDSPLFVKATGVSTLREGAPFFRSFVTEHWERICHLDVVTNLFNPPQPLGDEPSKWCSLFSRPSGLRYLKFWTSIPAGDVFPLLTSSLFPDLEEVDLADHPDTVTGGTALLPEDVFALSPSTFTFSVLRRIRLQLYWPHSANKVMCLLQTIVLKTSCELHLRLLSPDDLSAIRPDFPNVLQRYLQYARPVASLENLIGSITIEPDSMHIIIKLAHGRELFRFSLVCEDPEFSLQIPPAFISGLRKLQFNELKQLSLVLHPQIGLPSLATEIIEKCSIAFPCIEDLDMDGDTISQFSSLQQRTNSLLFYNLKSIVVRMCEADQLAAFIKSRQAKGGSVEELVLTLEPKLMAIFELLRSFSGLKVRISDPKRRITLPI